MLKGKLHAGPEHIIKGAKLLTRPELRPFIFIPLTINFILFLIATMILVQQFNSVLGGVLDWLPGWLDFLAWILWSLFAIILMMIYGYSFSIAANLIAAPFNGILAEKIETLISGKAPPPEPLSRMIPRTILRELLKIWYFLTRGIVIALAILTISFIPLVNILAAPIGLLWGAWTMAIQYIDYPADNHQLRFTTLRSSLGDQPLSSYSFGGIVMLGTMVPLLNIFMIPIAVAAATVFWVEEVEPEVNGPLTIDQ